MKRKILASVLSLCMMVSLLPLTAFAAKTDKCVDGCTEEVHVLGCDQVLPEPEVKDLGFIKVGTDAEMNGQKDYYYAENSYYIYDLIGSSGLSSSTEEFELQIAMEFIAKDSPEQAMHNFYGNYTTDFFIEFEGLEENGYVANGCYLAGYYPSFNAWVKIPLDGFEVKNDVIYPVITSANFDFKYVDICSGVEDFICGIYLSEDFLMANQDMIVTLTLGLSEDMDAALAGDYIVAGGESSHSFYAKDMIQYEAKIKDKGYLTLEDAMKDAKNGDTITLCAPVGLEEMLTVDKTVTIDLDTYTIYTEDGFTDKAAIEVVNGAELTLCGDEFVDDEGNLYLGNINSSAQAIRVGKNEENAAGAKLILDGVSVEATNNVITLWNDAEFVMESGTVQVAGTMDENGNWTAPGEYFAISTNGTPGKSAQSITIKDGFILSDSDVAMYLAAGDCKTVISGGIIFGKTAVEIRGGALDIKGGELRAEGDFDFSAASNNNGSTVIGAALAISQHTTNAPIDVQISGNTLLSGVKINSDGDYIAPLKAIYEKNLNDANGVDVDKNIALSIDGGAFLGEIDVTNVKGFIKNAGFTFNEENGYENALGDYKEYFASCKTLSESGDYIIYDYKEVDEEGNQVCVWGYKLVDDHTCESWNVTKAADCTTAGEKTGYCSVCEKDVTQVIEPTDHPNMRCAVDAEKHYAYCRDCDLTIYEVHEFGEDSSCMACGYPSDDLIPAVKVTFNTKVGTAPETVVMEKGDTLYKELPTLSANGYKFAGWYADSAFTTVWDMDTVIDKDTVIYAKWDVVSSGSSSSDDDDDDDDKPAPVTPAPTPVPETPAAPAPTQTPSQTVTQTTTQTTAQTTVTETTPETKLEQTKQEPAEMPKAADTTIVEVVASEKVVETVKETVTVSEGTATVDAKAVEAIVEATAEAEPVVLPIAQVTEEAVNKAEVDAEALAAVAEAEKDVVIAFADVTVKLDAEAVKAITEQANGAAIEIRAVQTETHTLTDAQQSVLADKETAVIVTAQIFSDGEYIGDFKGGKATIMLPFTPDEDKAAEDYKVYYIDELGELIEVAAEYVDGHMVFTTAHFSDYVIVYEGASSVMNTIVPEVEVTEEDSSFPIMPIALAIAIVVVGCVILVMKKKNTEA